ncbi:MAG TPA: hypothetical protein VHO90_09090 [Bacteroidales bacterium]|nr:hypothetical protein [Bacteroidales bacterium]
MAKKRKYRATDAVFLEFAGRTIAFLDDDLVLFNKYDPDLNSNVTATLQKLYDEALSFGTDNSDLGNVGFLSEETKKSVANCKSLYKDLRYFARKKFQKNPAVLKQFGIDKFRKARIRKADFLAFMQVVAKTAAEYKDDLAAAGMGEVIINSIMPSVEDLKTRNLDLESAKSERSLRAEMRVELMNGIYDILLAFSNAAKIIFSTDTLSRKKYILPYTKSTTAKKKPKNIRKQKKVVVDFVI